MSWTEDQQLRDIDEAFAIERRDSRNPAHHGSVSVDHLIIFR